ncbi:MAG: hypothetical protein ETSY2_44095 [Candidatus Entotheonella gemina]|uniref:Uncharacterized protein n=1 Tax=Candidatus Entotheonella gemina TaxID=1429439 RepID=W4LK34_9BACT|nr:MAG: hypothetical protein ETSY2_44095 [Candidatus Entotheonella gemina]
MLGLLAALVDFGSYRRRIIKIIDIVIYKE